MALGRAELAADARFRTNAARVEHRQDLIDALAECFLAGDTGHWLDVLTAVGVPAGPINTIADVFSDSYAAERQFVRQLPHAAAGTIATVANPVHFSKTPVEYRSAPPTLGQHTAEILAEELQYSPGEIAALREDGAI